MYEVELKFRLHDADSFLSRATACGATASTSVDQCDLYFNHPARDFAASDEAFRIRRIDQQHVVTYKGPVVDSQTKTRREIEVPLAGDGAGDKLSELLQFLGFRPVRQVRKHRRTYSLAWQNRPFEIALDNVEGLGEFVEIETLADEADRPAALSAILSLVAELQLPAPERKSYLSLLLERDPRNP